MKNPEGKKDPFKALDEDWRDEVAALDVDALKEKIAEVTLLQEAVMEAKENDQDLAKAKEAYDTAGAGYKEQTKTSKLRIKFIRRCIGDKGGDTGSF